MKLNNYFLLYNVNSYITYLITLEIFKYLSKDSELLEKKEKNFENSFTLDTFSISSQLLHKNSTRFRFISCQHKEETHSTAPQKESLIEQKWLFIPDKNAHLFQQNLP